jgi:hypothetical protein
MAGLGWLFDGFGCLQDDRAVACLDCNPSTSTRTVTCKRVRVAGNVSDDDPWSGLFGRENPVDDGTPCTCVACNKLVSRQWERAGKAGGARKAKIVEARRGVALGADARPGRESEAAIPGPRQDSHEGAAREGDVPENTEQVSPKHPHHTNPFAPPNTARSNVGTYDHRAAHAVVKHFNSRKKKGEKVFPAESRASWKRPVV